MKKKNTLRVALNGSKVLNQNVTTLSDGRSVSIQLWREAGSTYVTYFFSMEGLEEKSKEELYLYLANQGINLEIPFSKGRVTVQKFLNESKEQCWGMTIAGGRNE
ncbi:hypothetical protein H1D32_10790 [Anaerobacillus sp. CMMVII]|uniref:hypothetical protein n=1 Tax=Anaerobacillus sp. CMMVII TaxID=2755588 RepID=UPI0021B83A17|nr:hypothetical protein [Anaerobacillus sp. CMMVII]MCT8138199.1 hypothetical protein [Anaerobacillus sp. CMMVII]